MKNIIAVIFLLIFFQNYCQECVHTDLSKKYDFKTLIKRIPVPQVNFDSCIIKVGIVRKSTKAVQDVVLSGWIFKGDYSDCKDVRSYSTGFRQQVKVSENNFGDLIVADLNFDRREDLAIKIDSGGNGGPLYAYYVQDKNGNFTLDSFLSETMIFFPTKIDLKSKTLITLVHANAYELSETTYKLNTITGEWRKTKQRFVD